MNLLALREKFKNLSGRNDLVNADSSDNGMDFFINEGRKFLDRLDKVQKSWANHYFILDVDDFLIKFPNCRALKEVWLSTTSKMWRLEKIDIQDLLADQGTGLPSSLTSETPLYYAPCISRYVPEDMDAPTLATFASYVDIPSGITSEYNTALLNIPTSEKLAAIVKGLFYSMELVDDTDENYWSAMHPMLLYMSTMRQIEIVNRSTQGVNDWEGAILKEMKQLGVDEVDEEISDVTQIEE